MNSKRLACIMFLLNTVLFGTYYAIAKEALGRIDPMLFTFCEMMTLLPASICIIFCTQRQITRAVLKRGILLGSCLCLALFTIAIALKYTTATGTAFFPSLNGLLAAFLAWFLLRHPITKATWIAGAFSVVGTILLIANASMGGPRGSLIAFLGGVFFTGYVFLSNVGQEDKRAPWAIFGIELLTMTLWASLVVLLFGDWNAFHPQLPKDLWVILYVAGACTFLPTMITVLMQKHVSPVTVSFIYILEPVVGAIVATLYLRETLPLNGYLGGGLIVLGTLIHTLESANRNALFIMLSRLSVVRLTRRLSSLSTLATPVLFYATGAFVLTALHGSLLALVNDFYRSVILALVQTLYWQLILMVVALTSVRTSQGALNALRRKRLTLRGEARIMHAHFPWHMDIMAHKLAFSTRKLSDVKSSGQPLQYQNRREHTVSNEGTAVLSRLLYSGRMKRQSMHVIGKIAGAQKRRKIGTVATDKVGL